MGPVDRKMKARMAKNNKQRDERFKEALLSDAAGSGDAISEPIMFPGSQSFSKGKPVVASFPGRYAKAWNMIIGGEHVVQRSNLRSTDSIKKKIAVDTCCVFLPDKRSPGYGDCFSICPDGRCWCEMSLEEGGLGYGHKEPWGCHWYTLWQANMRKAIAADVRFICFYFRGHQRSMGQADWDNVGRSQQAEINWMLKNGISFEDHPIDVFLDVAVESENMNKGGGSCTVS